MADERCSCDEALALRLENARLRGVIEGMREGLALPPKAMGLCTSKSPDGQHKCELPAWHAGPHGDGDIHWSYG